MQEKVACLICIHLLACLLANEMEEGEKGSYSFPPPCTPLGFSFSLSTRNGLIRSGMLLPLHSIFFLQYDTAVVLRDPCKVGRCCAQSLVVVILGDTLFFVEMRDDRVAVAGRCDLLLCRDCLTMTNGRKQCSTAAGLRILSRIPLSRIKSQEDARFIRFVYKLLRVIRRIEKVLRCLN